MPVYHPDVRAWEVTDAEGRHVGLFLGDYFARTSKRSGAWMSGFRGQEKLAGDIRPIVVNVMNFSKAGEGQPTLLSFDDARTLFHEFGHALHGLLSDVTYPHDLRHERRRAISSSSPRSSSSIGWSSRSCSRRFAVHWQDRRADAGGAAEEACSRRAPSTRVSRRSNTPPRALVDLDLHLLDDAERPRYRPPSSAQSLERIGMPEAIVMRHRPPHFAHIFSGDGYAAGYYSYMWSEVLDADGFAAFEEAGDIFDPPPPNGCTTTSTRPAICATRRRPTAASAAACRCRRRSCASAG